MARRIYALANGAGVFFDERTGLKVLPGKKVMIDTDSMGARTQTAIQNGHLVEAAADAKKESSTPPAK